MDGMDAGMVGDNHVVAGVDGDDLFRSFFHVLILPFLFLFLLMLVLRMLLLLLLLLMMNVHVVVRFTRANLLPCYRCDIDQMQHPRTFSFMFVSLNRH